MSNKYRKKGNSQAASSSRAAELLQASGGLGLDILSLIPGSNVDVEEVSNVIDEIGLNIDPELRVIFKKLSKRDAQTREKSIKELFDELKLRSNDIEKLKNNFSCFASGYPKLVTDCSTIVRSISDSLLALFISNLKKDAGSQLKVVIPYLFFSCQDGHFAVAKSAETAVNDCFPSEEKKQRAIEAFAEETITLCLQIMAKQHKLVAPQKFTEEETDAQRLTRLVAQAINSLEKFLECSPKLLDAIAPKFVSSSTFNSLMNLDLTVKAAAFRLLKKLIKKDVGIILGTRIPSYILQYLGADDQLTCKNVFECFIIAAADPRFYETCKIDKAVIPKLINLIRKKGLHWNVLESSLLPSISVVYDNLSSLEDKQKWIQSVIYSFFDDVSLGIPLNSWTKALCEILKYSFLRISDIKTNEYKAFLSEQTSRFIGVAISFGEKQPVESVVDLLMWIQSKTDLVGEEFTNDFNSNISRKLLALLPKSIPILEGYVQLSSDFTVIVDLLKNDNCPNETFLKCFKSLDSDSVDMKIFGDIIVKRIYKEKNYSVLKKLMNLLIELLDDGEIPGKFDDYFKDKPSLVSWSIVDLCNDDYEVLFGDLNITAEVIINDILNGHMLVDEKKIIEFFEDKIDYEYKNVIIKKKLKEFNDELKLDNLLKLIKIFGKIDEELCDTIFNMLLQLYLNNHDELNENSMKMIKDNTVNFGSQFKVDSLKKMIENIINQNDNHDVENLYKIAKLMSLLNLKIEQLMKILPDEGYVKQWLHYCGSTYLLELLLKSDFNELYTIVFNNIATADIKLDINQGIKQGIFYGNLAYLCCDKFDENEGKGKFGYTSLFLLILEMIIEVKSNNGMFSPVGIECREFQTLMNIIDRILQDLRFEYHQYLSTMDKTNPEISIAVYTLNKMCKSENRRHINLSENITEVGHELMTIIQEVYKINEMETAVEFLQKFVEEKRQKYEEWMFNFGLNNKVKESTSYVMMKLSSGLIGNEDISPEIRDFILCGHVCAMQSITDNLKNKNEDNIFYQATGIYCLELFNEYDKIVKTLDSTILLEWNDFYRPAAIGQIMSWFYAICDNHNDDDYRLSDYFVNKVCGAVMNLNKAEIESVNVPELLQNDIKISKTINNSIIKLAINLIFTKSKDACKYAAIYLLKMFMIDLFEESHKFEVDFGEEGPSNEEIEKDSKESKVTNLPPILDQILSTEEFTVLQKLMVWDSLIQFLNSLDVMTRVKYLLRIPVKYCDEILDIFFELLPKYPERHLKEYSFKGKLNLRQLFSKLFTFDDACSTTFEHYICNLFYRTCTTLPSVVRDWFIGLSKSKLNDVNEYIKKYLSPLLIEKEMKATKNMTKGRLTIQVMPAVHEIQAKYKFDEATLALEIKLHDDYPLSKPTVDAQRTIVNKNVLRKWLLQLIQFLNNENGLLLDGILQWKRNIDNHLEGVEECTICMMTINPTNYQLPKIKCRQCKKKFHGNCLYKWFDTSNNPTCPLCRSAFY